MSQQKKGNKYYPLDVLKLIYDTAKTSQFRLELLLKDCYFGTLQDSDRKKEVILSSMISIRAVTQIMDGLDLFTKKETDSLTIDASTSRVLSELFVSLSEQYKVLTANGIDVSLH